MPELWLRKIVPKTVFVSTDFAENRVRVTKSQQELDQLDDDCTDIFKSNIIVRYSDRPKDIPVINSLSTGGTKTRRIRRIIFAGLYCWFCACYQGENTTIGFSVSRSTDISYFYLYRMQCK